MIINRKYKLVSLLYLNNPDMSKEQFTAELERADSPAKDSAGDSYDILAKYPVSIRGCLAIFHHESDYGTKGVIVRNDTKSPGNVRTSSTGKGRSITDSQRAGFYQKFDTWEDGWREIPHRFINPKYPYAQHNALTIEDIMPLYAPPSDSNTPESYISFMVEDMSRDIMALPDRYKTIDGLRVDWLPSPLSNFGGGHEAYEVIVIHSIEGSAQSGISTLQDPTREASTHLLTDPNNNRIAQMVGMYSTAWTAGSYKGNTRGINIENPGFAGRPFDPKVVEYCGRAVGVLAKDANIPLIRLNRVQANTLGVKGVCAHGDFDQNGPRSQWHWDPGPTWPWDQMLEIARKVSGQSMPTSPPSTFFPETGYGIHGGIRANFEANGGVSRFGYPRSWEYDTYDLNGKTVRVQWFERGRAEWRQGSNPDHFDVLWGLLGNEMIGLMIAAPYRNTNEWLDDMSLKSWAFTSGESNRPDHV